MKIELNITWLPMTTWCFTESLVANELPLLTLDLQTTISKLQHSHLYSVKMLWCYFVSLTVLPSQWHTTVALLRVPPVFKGLSIKSKIKSLKKSIKQPTLYLAGICNFRMAKKRLISGEKLFNANDMIRFSVSAVNHMQLYAFGPQLCLLCTASRWQFVTRPFAT